MDDENLSEAAPAQLDRILAFFPRADAKGSVLLAVDTGMLAVLAANVPPSTAFDCWLLALIVPLFLIGGSLWHLYKGAFPSLEGGHDSLIYFREIAKRTESKYIDEFVAQTKQDFLKDMLSQVWRNSQILKEKFDHISASFRWTAFAIGPWAACLVVLAIHYAQRKSP
jgi:hypothetical protein